MPVAAQVHPSTNCGGGQGNLANSDRIQLEQSDYRKTNKQKNPMDSSKDVSSLYHVGSSKRQNGFRNARNFLGIILVKDKGERDQE